MSTSSRTHRSVCPLDCPDNCSLHVVTVGDRITRVDGSTFNPTTEGYICAKVRGLPDALYGEDRVRTPLVRDGARGAGSFRAAGWDEALDLVAGNLRETRDRFGGEAILPYSYGGSNGYLSQDTLDARLFRRLGASHLARTVCAAPTGAAAGGLYGKMAGVAYEDYRAARLLVLWGVNPRVSGVHQVPHIQAAQAAGARLVVIDPRRTRLAARADLHVAPRPGTDLPLALAVIRWLVEHDAVDREFLDRHTTGWERLRERAMPWNPHYAANICGLTAREIEELAAWYAESAPALIRCGWGLERNRNGGSAVAAVLALPAVAGKFGVRGGGYTLSNSSVWALSTEAAVAEPPPAVRTINMNKLGHVLGDDTLDPPVRHLFVYNCNPLATVPHQTAVQAGLMREDLFTVVFDSFLTDTAVLADVVLPATPFLERRELARGYGSYSIQDAPAVTAPFGESRSNHAVFLDLLHRLGLARPGDPETEDEVAAAMLAAAPGGGRLQRELGADGFARPECGAQPVQFGDVFPNTGDRKVQLFPDALDREAPEGLYGYRPDPATEAFPLALISPATRRTTNSTLGQLVREPARLAMHPIDATPRGIADGDRVRVWNGLGEVHCPVEIAPRVRAGVVELPKGLWLRHTGNGYTSNALSPDTLTDLGGGACFNDARVQVEAIRPATS